VKRAFAAIGLVACSSTSPAGDPFPVHVDLTSGAVMVHIARPGDATPLVATLDVLAPFTLIDPGPGEKAVERVATDVALFGQATAGSSALIERARFDVDVVSLHPCDLAQAKCTVGPASAPIAIDAVLGADAIGGSAIRFDLPRGDLYVFPDIAGETRLRDSECDGVFPSPFRGGGTLVLGGADVSFSGRRVAIGACLGDDVTDTAKGTGVDALFVWSTGIGPTVISESAYQLSCVDQCARPCIAACTDASDQTCVTACREPCATTCKATAAASPAAQVLLPSGAISGHQGTLATLSLVAAPEALGTVGSRGPCRDLHAARRLPLPELSTDDQAALCTDQSTCSAPATIELTPTTPIPVVVVPDADPTLQALRAELRPDQPEVDGILGVDAMRALTVDLDYPNNRLLARCRGQAGCLVRPQLTSLVHAASVMGCN